MASIAKKEKKSDPPPTTKQPPGIRPPAKIGSSTHGPGDGKPQSEMHGSARLRSVLSLSANVAVEQVCDEAATMIESLRRAKTIANTARYQPGE